MPNRNLTEIVVIADRSGSMASIRADAEGGFNFFLEEQKKLPGNANLTFVEFSSGVSIVCENKPIHDVEPWELFPTGSTALLDAIGITLLRVGERLRQTSEEERPGKVLVVIITDGEENSSQEFNRAKIFEMIKHQREKYNWEFLFLAANQDAIQEGLNYGIFNATNFKATGQGIQSAYMNVTNCAAQYRSTGHIDQMPVNAEEVKS